MACSRALSSVGRNRARSSGGSGPVGGSSLLASAPVPPTLFHPRDQHDARTGLRLPSPASSDSTDGTNAQMCGTRRQQSQCGACRGDAGGVSGGMQAGARQRQVKEGGHREAGPWFAHAFGPGVSGQVQSILSSPTSLFPCPFSPSSCPPFPHTPPSPRRRYHRRRSMLNDLLNVAPGSISDVAPDDLGSLWTGKLASPQPRNPS